jgi:hypothetical protein
MRVGGEAQGLTLERFCHCATGVRCGVEIEAEWNRRKREGTGAPLRVKVRTTLARQNLLEWRRGRPAYHLYEYPSAPQTDFVHWRVGHLRAWPPKTGGPRRIGRHSSLQRVLARAELSARKTRVEAGAETSDRCPTAFLPAPANGSRTAAPCSRSLTSYRLTGRWHKAVRRCWIAWHSSSC